MLDQRDVMVQLLSGHSRTLGRDTMPNQLLSGHSRTLGRDTMPNQLLSGHSRTLGHDTMPKQLLSGHSRTLGHDTMPNADKQNVRNITGMCAPAPLQHQHHADSCNLQPTIITPLRIHSGGRQSHEGINVSIDRWWRPIE